MGTDNIFQRRKPKSASKLKRKGAIREPYDKVLIVCEGSKTEPNYFRGLIDYFKLKSANVAIDGSCGSSPCSVLKRAQELQEKELKSGSPFDKVYCVFDKDAHQTYQATMDKIAKIKPKGVFNAANSIPSFEFWLLLHFIYSTKPYIKNGKMSSGDLVKKDLLVHHPDYKKKSKDTFLVLQPKLETAIANAAKVLATAERNGTDNPTTHIHTLVEYLRDLNKKKKTA